ncbi:MAG: tRNA (N6-threonylcarbamoyladenosine(37)-N6)-methyltransferase TrmO [Candidatus Acidiferrales bacterium]
MKPIGYVRSPFKNSQEIPKGLGVRHEAEGILEIKEELETGLTDVEGFSHLFVLWAFDRSDGFDLLGTPPIDDRPHGVFATRSPRRPNPIGLTVVELLRRDGPRLHVRGVDMLDGTPVLDIKPYLSSVSAEQLRRGWLAEAEARGGGGMDKLRGTAIAILLLGALACAGLTMAQAQKPAPVAPRNRMAEMALIAPNDSRMTGVNAVRLINTAQAGYKHAHGRYATWDELYRSGIMANDRKRSPQFSGLQLAGGPEVVEGWTLAMIVAADGQSYELSLRNLQDKCQFSFFSDQRGLIFQGKVIGCAASMVPAHQ